MGVSYVGRDAGLKLKASNKRGYDPPAEFEDPSSEHPTLLDLNIVSQIAPAALALGECKKEIKIRKNI